MSDEEIEIELTEEQMDLVAEMRFIRDEAKELKKREAELREKLLGFMGEASVGRGRSGPMVTITTSERRTVDSKKLEAVYPGIYSQVVTEKTVVTVKIP